MAYAAKTDWVDYDIEDPLNPNAIPTASDMNRIEEGINKVYIGTHIYGVSEEGADTYKIAFATPFTELTEGMHFRMKIDIANTAASSLQIDSMPAKNIKILSSIGKIDTRTGDMVAAGIYDFYYDGVDFILVDPTVNATNILELVKTVDGTGSGLDADLLDGKNANEFASFKKSSATFTDNDTSQTFTDSFCTADSLVVISITSATSPKGLWSVESADDSFTITSDTAESDDITFDYYITKVGG